MRHLLSAELCDLNASYLFATMYRETSKGLSLLESLSWPLLRRLAASFNAAAAIELVACSSFRRRSTTFLMSLIHLNRETRQLLGLDKSQHITTADVARLPTVKGTSSSLGSEISPPAFIYNGLHAGLLCRCFRTILKNNSELYLVPIYELHSSHVMMTRRTQLSDGQNYNLMQKLL